MKESKKEKRREMACFTLGSWHLCWCAPLSLHKQMHIYNWQTILMYCDVRDIAYRKLTFFLGFAGI